MTAKIRFIFTLSVLILTTSCTNRKVSKDVPVIDKIKMTSNNNEMFLFAGTYTSPQESQGIYLYRINIESGVVDSVSMIEADNPSFLVLSQNEKNLYAVGESGKNSSVSSFLFDKSTGAITHLNTIPSGGADPCYIEIDEAGENLLTANYSGGSISVFSITSEGSISGINSILKFNGSGPDSLRQSSSHLHSVRFSPESEYIFATDLGSDKVYRFKYVKPVFEGQPVISESEMIEIDMPSGMGPRHFDYHPSGKYMYILGELSGEILVCEYVDGLIHEKQRVVSDSLHARGSADIHVSPDGRFLYASNRLEADGLSIFSIDEDNGELNKVGYQYTGLHPRNFIITPNGSFLLVACRDDNRIQIFSIDKESGELSDTNNDIYINKPVCLKLASS